MENSKIRAFEDAVIDFFNASSLEPEIKRLVAQNVLNLITKEADKIIIKELREEKKDGLRENNMGG